MGPQSTISAAGNGSAVSIAIAGLALLTALLAPTPAFAHASEGALVLLLPTGHYILGGTAAVAASVVILSLVPPRRSLAFHSARLRLPSFEAPDRVVTAIATLSFLVFAFMVVAGFLGSRDPLKNPLPSFIWTVFWTILFFLHAVFGNLWALLNPWKAPLKLIRRLRPGWSRVAPPLTLPVRIGYLPAIVQFAAFGWFELVDLAPDDPARLATAVTGFYLLNLAGFILFGEDAWRARGEPFGILFGLIGRLSPLGFERDGEKVCPVLSLPCGQAYDVPPLPLSGVVFVLMTLSTVTFDGLSTTFVWLSAVGINPLEYPGRSEVVASSTTGLLLAPAVFIASFFGAIALGRILAGGGSIAALAGRLIISILPISLGFQFAHYLTLAMIGVQDFIAAMHAPFGEGGFRLGAPPAPATLSFLNNYETVAMIFAAQTGAITIGHLLAVLLAHGLPGPEPRPRLLDLPFAILMIAYTAFGLWLLATPRV